MGVLMINMAFVSHCFIFFICPPLLCLRRKVKQKLGNFKFLCVENSHLISH